MEGCTHGSQGLSTGWSTNGSTLLSIPWKREHPWVPRGKHRLEHQWWLRAGVHPMEEGAPMGPCCVLPMEEGAPMGSKWQTLVGAPMVAPSCCPSHGRGSTHGSQGLSTGWSTRGSMLCPSNGRGCTHGSQGANTGWSINGGSMLVSIPWKREHPWVHSGVLPMEEGAPMGPKG